MEAIAQYGISGIFQGSIYALIAVGIVIVFKATKVFNFAQGHLLMMGVLLSLIFINRFNIWIAIPLAIACAAGIGYVMERVALRPLIGQPVVSGLLMTLALAYMLDGVATIFWGTKIVPYPQWYPERAFPIAGIEVSSGIVWSILVAAGIFIALALFYRRSLMGKAMRATADSHQVSQSLGIKVTRISSMCWLMAAVIAFIMAFFFGVHVGAFRYLSEWGFRAIPAVLIGGLDSILGALVGGLLVGVLEVIATAYLGAYIGSMFPFIVLLIAIIAKPHGLFGQAEIVRV
ncbi:MAG: branched-chain amino acid ABC transporter permease [Desulfobacterales bacterium]|nr:branched-chain amino acid ABC transporter permease [Desulfobacterales bacterium]